MNPNKYTNKTNKEIFGGTQFELSCTMRVTRGLGVTKLEPAYTRGDGETRETRETRETGETGGRGRRRRRRRRGRGGDEGDEGDEEDGGDETDRQTDRQTDRKTWPNPLENTPADWV